jgi:hypothetical protein
MSHLGAFAAEKTPGQVGSVPFDARVVGVWEGNTSKALGGYRQRIEFHNETWQRFSKKALGVHRCGYGPFPARVRFGSVGSVGSVGSMGPFGLNWLSPQ